MGLLGIALIGGGLGLNLVGPVAGELDEEDELMALNSFALPSDNAVGVEDGAPFSHSFSELLADELRLTGEQSLEKLELSPVTGEDVVERFDGEDDRLDKGEGNTGLKANLARLLETVLWLLVDTEVEPFSELSVQAPSDDTDSLSISVLILFFDKFCAVLNDRSVGSRLVKNMLLLFVSGK